MNSETFGSVDEALARLPRALTPARDLWPAIAQATASGAARERPEPGPARWPVALAASLALLGLVAALSFSVLRQPGASALLAQDGTASTPAKQTSVSFESPRTAAFISARAALETTYQERLAMLAPATRARVQADLETIRKANVDIRDALSRDPASPLLQQLLRSTWQQEIDLYTDVSQATEPMLTRRT
ncbi:MAG TPA: hypothetical protein VK505_06780 [Steroidobacteraceae bacterium]|jgi:hypothetical protein|nr:hypothetical protein [Steroidobacteraceae bacterium]